MANSTTAEAPRKPRGRKPTNILTPRGDGRWCKRVNGKLHYFYGNAEEALEEWTRVEPYLRRGLTPPPKVAPAVNAEIGPVVADVVNHFLTFKRSLVNSGELTMRSWAEYDDTCGLVVEFFGRDCPVKDLTPAQFQAFRVSMAERWGPVRLGNQIQRVRSVFKFAFEMDLIERPIKFGPGFEKPAAKTLRKAREEKGKQDFTADEIKKLLAVARPNMKAAVLLGINGGLGPTDLGLLKIPHLDLDGGWLNYPRAKTGIARRIPLWRETVAAIRELLAVRRKPKRENDADYLLISSHGKCYVRESCRRAKRDANGVAVEAEQIREERAYAFCYEFRRLAEDASITNKGFYALRRSFETQGDNLSHDKDSVKFIMGHSFGEGDMTNRYRQGFYDSRLRAVVEHVRAWLFSEEVRGG
jgi:integrase